MMQNPASTPNAMHAEPDGCQDIHSQQGAVPGDQAMQFMGNEGGMPPGPTEQAEAGPCGNQHAYEVPHFTSQGFIEGRPQEANNPQSAGEIHGNPQEGNPPHAGSMGDGPVTASGKGYENPSPQMEAQGGFQTAQPQMPPQSGYQAVHPQTHQPQAGFQPAAPQMPPQGGYQPVTPQMPPQGGYQAVHPQMQQPQGGFQTAQPQMPPQGGYQPVNPQMPPQNGYQTVHPQMQPQGQFTPGYADASQHPAHTSGPPQSHHPKFEEHKYGQFFDVVNGFVNGEPDIPKMMGLLESCDTQFWKGALVGIAGSLILTNETVQKAITGSLAGIMGAFQKETTEEYNHSRRLI